MGGDHKNWIILVTPDLNGLKRSRVMHSGHKTLLQKCNCLQAWLQKLPITWNQFYLMATKTPWHDSKTSFTHHHHSPSRVFQLPKTLLRSKNILEKKSNILPLYKASYLLFVFGHHTEDYPIYLYALHCNSHIPNKMLHLRHLSLQFYSTFSSACYVSGMVLTVTMKQ